jgi:mannose-6-phosphate isomerase-like protein (cupin superfamily)
MKRKAGNWMGAILTAGAILLGAAYNVRARSHTPVPVTRLYTGSDGLTHAEAMDAKLSLRPGGDLYEQGEMLKATGAQIVRAAPGYVQDWHTAPRRQYLITISGRGEIEVAGGKKVSMTPGQILLVEDLTGKGHLTRTIGDQDRVSVIVPLE